MNYRSINLQQKFGLFREQWLPKVVAEMNDYQFKVVKLQGDFIWHRRCAYERIVSSNDVAPPNITLQRPGGSRCSLPCR